MWNDDCRLERNRLSLSIGSRSGEFHCEDLLWTLPVGNGLFQESRTADEQRSRLLEWTSPYGFQTFLHATSEWITRNWIRRLEVETKVGRLMIAILLFDLLRLDFDCWPSMQVSSPSKTFDSDNRSTPWSPILNQPSSKHFENHCIDWNRVLTSGRQASKMTSSNLDV